MERSDDEMTQNWEAAESELHWFREAEKIHDAGVCDTGCPVCAWEVEQEQVRRMLYEQFGVR